MARPILDDGLRAIIEAIFPPPKKRRFRYPGRKPVDNFKALSGILFVLRTGIPWEDLPAEFGCCGMTCWRRLRDWTKAGVWEQLHRVLLDLLNEADQIDWERAVIDSSSVRAVFGGRKPGQIRPIAARRAASTTSSRTGRGFPWPRRSPVRTRMMSLN
jgi:transposase